MTKKPQLKGLDSGHDEATVAAHQDWWSDPDAASIATEVAAREVPESVPPKKEDK